jgi:hypothetical protein
VRYLVRCGWLRLETAHDFTRVCILPDYAVHLLGMFSTLAVSATPPLHGLLYSIHDLLQAAASEPRTPAAATRIAEAHRQSLLLQQGFMALQHNIGLHIEHALQQFKSSAALKRFFERYRGEILDPLFRQLWAGDEVARLSSATVQALTHLEQRVPASETVQQVQRMRLLFQSLERTMQAIALRHHHFADGATRSVQFQLNEQRTTAAHLHRLLTSLVNHPAYPALPLAEWHAHADTLITLFSLTLPDAALLETVPEPLAPFTAAPPTHPKPTPAEVAQARASLQQHLNRAATREQVRRFALDLLRDQAEIRGADIPLDTPHDLPLLIALRGYGDGSLGYTVEPPPGDAAWVERGGVGFYDFVLRRAG